MSEREPSVLGGPEAGAADASDPGSEPHAPTRKTPEQKEKSGPKRRPPSQSGAREPRSGRPGGKRPAPTFYAAGFWRRAAAAAIDLAIILPVSLILCWLAGAITGIHLPPSRYRALDTWLDLLLANDPALLAGLGLTFAIAAVYVMVFQTTMSRTPGMKVLKTRIIDLYGDPPSTARAAARTAGYVACVATLGLGFLWIGFDSEKRGLHDWISGTHVVKA